MLKSNILASNLIYISVKTRDPKYKLLFKTLEPIFEKIADCETGYDIKKLQMAFCHSTFQRLN